MENQISTEKCLKIKVLGRVQGVSFRTTAKRKAINLGLNGYVQNQSDGSVLIQAEGDSDNLDKFIDWCHEGSYHSRVKECIVEETKLEDYFDFKIVQ